MNYYSKNCHCCQLRDYLKVQTVVKRKVHGHCQLGLETKGSSSVPAFLHHEESGIIRVGMTSELCV